MEEEQVLEEVKYTLRVPSKLQDAIKKNLDSRMARKSINSCIIETLEDKFMPRKGEFVKISDLAEDFIRTFEDKQANPNKYFSVFKEKYCLVIKYTPGKSHWDEKDFCEYDIGFDQINSYKQCLWWINHLMEKDWFTIGICEELIRKMMIIMEEKEELLDPKLDKK